LAFNYQKTVRSIVLIIISLIILFIASYYVYEAAKKNGHNALIWTVLAVFAFIGTYLFLLTAFGIIINIGLGKSVWTMSSVQYVGELVHLVILGLSMGSVILILRQVSKKKDKDSLVEKPLPSFDGK